MNNTRKWTMGSTLGALVLGVFAMAGCDGQVDPEYKGEPLATVKGALSGSDSGQAELDVMLVWSKLGGQILPSVTRASLEADFPRRFSISVFQPPPAHVIMDVNDEGQQSESPVAFAYLALLRTGDEPETQEDIVDMIVGGSRTDLLFWAERDITEDSLLGKMLGRPMSAGYHLMTTRPFTSDERDQLATCRADAEAAGTEPDAVCPSFKQHIEPKAASQDVLLELSSDPDLFPDLS